MTRGELLRRRRTWRDASVALVLLWWAVPLVRGTGGREPHLLSIGLVLLVVATALVRPWRELSRRVYACLVAVPVAAFLVVTVAPTGWEGGVEAGSWAFATQLAALVLAWARDAARRTGVLLVFVLAAGYEFSAGWLAWWGGEDPRRAFVGTFYWHNQAGVFLATGSVVAAGLLVARIREARVAAWVVAPLGLAGTVVSTSRASMGAAGVGFLVLVTAALSGARRWRGLARLATAAGLGIALAFVLTGPPFFHERTSALAGTAARGAGGETLAANGGYRLKDWEWAGRLFTDRPVAGTGFHGFADASAQLDPAGRGALTPFAHNGYLQVLAEGGLLLAVPVLALLVGLCLRAARAARGRSPVTGAALAGLVVLLLHSGVDFDWSYPALLAAPALLGGALPGGRDGSERPRASPLLGALALALLVVSVAAAWHGSLDLSAKVR